MYKIPDTANFSSFHGTVLQTLSFGSNIISLNFENGHAITIEGAFTLTDAEGIISIDHIYPLLNDCGLIKLLDRTLEHVEINETRDGIALMFARDVSLQLFANPSHESFSIYRDDERIIV